MLDQIVTALLAVTISITTINEQPVIQQDRPTGEISQEYAELSDRQVSTTNGGVGDSKTSGEIPIDTILPKIYQLESSSGRNDACKTRGLYNGYGFGQNTTSWNCFESLDEVETKVAAWFEKNLKDKTMSQALCYYNIGQVVDWCPYIDKYASL